MLNQLICLADMLDQKGLHKEADMIDEIIKESQIKERIKDVGENLLDAFKGIALKLKEKAKENPELMKDVMKVMEDLMKSGIK